MPAGSIEMESESDSADNADISSSYTVDTAISEVIRDAVFGDYGRLIFPVNSGYYSGDTYILPQTFHRRA